MTEPPPPPVIRWRIDAIRGRMHAREGHGTTDRQNPEDAMTKHIADRPRDTDDNRLTHYTRIERDGRARPQTMDLQRRPRDTRDEGRRAQEFTRIERGQEV